MSMARVFLPSGKIMWAYFFFIFTFVICLEENRDSYSGIDHRSLFSVNALPRLKDIDMIDLYHLRSFPNSLVITSSSGSRFHMQTSGLALRSTQSSHVVVLEYRPMNLSCSFLPIVDSTSSNNDSIDLVWDKRAEIYYADNIDIKYWQQSTFLARINGVVYENYIEWVEEYVREHRIFTPQPICSSSDPISCFTKSRTWETFVSDRY